MLTVVSKVPDCARCLNAKGVTEYISRNFTVFRGAMALTCFHGDRLLKRENNDIGGQIVEESH